MSAKYLLLLSFSLFLILGTMAYAQLGEQAGQPSFNISVGSSSTFNYSILNSGSSPIPFKVVPPTLNIIPHNATPIVTVVPMNGTLAPNSQQVISIRVSIPYSDKPYLKWQGILSVVEVSPTQNITGGTGAVIEAGIAKIVTIESAPAKGIPEIYYIISALVVIIAVGLIIYLLSKKRSRAAMARRKARTAYVKARIRGKKLKPATKTAKKRSAERKTRKSVRKRAKTSTKRGRTKAAVSVKSKRKGRRAH
ncbi:MAG: hypothetical protein M1465_02620 [Candidatus Marsarchaeota archaeon]|nr:hypothetical protein [Candidatus Marsarchaeota archaeon]